MKVWQRTLILYLLFGWLAVLSGVAMRKEAEKGKRLWFKRLNEESHEFLTSEEKWFLKRFTEMHY